MRPLLAMSALTAALTLAGCGGGSNYSDAPPAPPTTTPPPPVSMVDAFFNAVMTLIGDGKETTTEPVATDGIAATTPEDAEPAAVK